MQKTFNRGLSLRELPSTLLDWVTWDYRIEELIFYNEKSELPRDQQPQKKYKP